MQILSFLALL